MSARQVHAIVAAGLADPRLLEEWARDPEALKAGGEDAGGLDLATLRKFAGLTMSVKHNGLRQDFPLTYALLRAARLEIDLFAAYAVRRTGPSGKLAADAAGRAADLVDFIDRWIDPGRRDHVLLRAIARHEAALLQLRGRGPCGPETAVDSSETWLGARVPTVRGILLLQALAADPRAIAAALESGSDRLAGVGLDPVNLGYWRRPGEEGMHLLELDEFAFQLLRRVDGRASVNALSRTLVGAPPSAAFAAAVGQLAELGLIGLADARA